ncbi:MAG: transcription termination/antitermination NusG family protein [Acidobacteriota bacterium]
MDLEMADSAQWYAIRVRSRSEKSVAAYLESHGLEVCSAVCRQRRAWSDRIQVVELPLFPGYIFARFGQLRRREILTAPGAAGIVGFGATDCPVDDREIASLQTMLKSGVELQRVPFLAVGARIRVRSGPFREAVGVLEQFKAGHRLVVSVSLLQRSVAVEMDEAMVEPVSAAARSGASSAFTGYARGAA